MMATLSTDTLSLHLRPLAAHGNSLVNFSAGALVAAKRIPSWDRCARHSCYRSGILLRLSSRNRSGGGSMDHSSYDWHRPSTFQMHKRVSGACSVSLADNPVGGIGIAADNAAGGIGIAEFLGGKNFLITSGTGFLAKVIIEKILRTNDDVGKIYVVIKAKDTEAASKRLRNEITGTELFKCLEEIHGEDYHSFVANKVVPVVGDIREINLGIAAELADEIAEEVDIIVNSAANTTLDQRYDVAVDTNTLGPCIPHHECFAQQFRRLKLFLHVSTAYVNGQRQGVALEKPFRLGDTIAKELFGSSGSSEYEIPPLLDIEAEVKLAFASRIHSSSDDSAASSHQEMKHLGLERANLHGWQDAYVFSKALGEMVINCMRGDIPVVIIRPSVIEGTLRDPVPGWIQGNRVIDPFILHYGKGRMTSFLGDPDCVFDVIPADMVANATLASMAKHGGHRHGRRPTAAAGMHVYHVCSSTANPVVYKDVFEFFLQHFTRSPFLDAAGQPITVKPMRFRASMEEYTSDVEANAAGLLRLRRDSTSSRSMDSERRREVRRRSMFVENIIHLGRIYEPYTFYVCRFDNGNTEALLAEMSAEERANFDFNVQGVDWMSYFTDVHIPGLRKYVMKGRGSV